VDRQRGRFRTFVLHACEYFLAKEWRDATRLKRGGGQQILSLDVAAAEDWYQNEPADQMTPERLYERQWVLSLLELALERLRQEWVAAGKATLFATLQLFLSGERKSMTCAQAALELGMSEGAVRTAVHRLRQQYAQILRAEVAQTLSREEDLEEELRHLISVLRT
jgi:RNA polymerase sigma-70 factor (ECF subfamily)